MRRQRTPDERVVELLARLEALALRWRLLGTGERREALNMIVATLRADADVIEEIEREVVRGSAVTSRY